MAVAYYLLISIFPILLTLANLLPYFPFDVDAILSVLAEFIPEKIYPTVSNFVTNIPNFKLKLATHKKFTRLLVVQAFFRVIVNPIFDKSDFFRGRFLGSFW